MDAPVQMLLISYIALHFSRTQLVFHSKRTCIPVNASPHVIRLTQARETLRIEVKRYSGSWSTAGGTHPLRRLRIVQKPRPILIDIHGHVLP